jgi:hypothetical protein
MASGNGANAEVAQQRGDPDTQQATVFKGTERVEQAGDVPGARRRGQQQRRDDQRDSHQRADPEERVTPRDRRQYPADQWADGDAKPQSSLVEDDRLRHRPLGRGDDGGQRGRDEQRIAQAPQCSPADDAQHRVRHTGQAGACDDYQKTKQQSVFRPDATGHDTGDQHRHTHHRRVAGEQ